MAKRGKIRIYPQVFRKILEEYFGGSVEELSSIVNKSAFKEPEKTIETWVSEGGYATTTQIDELSRKLLIPPLLLYLNNPDFIPSRPKKYDHRIRQTHIPYTERRKIRRAEILQMWLEDIYDFETSTDVLYGAVDNDPTVMAEKLREVLKFDIEKQLYDLENPDEVFEYLRSEIESSGIAVMRLPLDTKYLRGLAIHGRVPVIVVSSKDSPTAVLFTLIHELCHILRRKLDSGVEICRDFTVEQEKANETFCNRVAGRFLLPLDVARREYEKHRGESIEEIVKSIAKDYKVSRDVVFLRLIELGISNREEYDRYVESFGEIEYRTGIRRSRNHARTKLRRYGFLIVSSIIDAVRERKLRREEAMWLLEIRKPEIFDDLSEVIYGIGV